MKWFKEALEHIYQPYDLRGLYNRNKRLVLDGGMYEPVMNTIKNLREIHSSSSLDLNTLDGIQEDIEADLDNLVFIQKDHVEKTKEETVIEIFERQLAQKKHDDKSCISDGKVYLDIKDTRSNLLEAVEKEALVQALRLGGSRSETADLLGISYRTLTNKIRKHFRESVNLD